MSTRKLLALLLLLGAVCCVVRAQEESDGPPPEEDYDATTEEESEDRVTGVHARVFFTNQDPVGSPTFPAGEKVVAQVTVTSDVKNPTYDVFFINGFISRLGDFNGAIQNFTGTQHRSPVPGGETSTFMFTFMPDKLLDPQDYNLVVRVFFITESNKTFVAVGYNSSVTVADPLGADPKTFMLFGTIAAIVGGIAFVVNLRRKKTYKPRPRPSAETGTKDNTYDPAYISDEHTRFRDQLLRKNTPSPAKKK
jgi:hypothetical protein